MNYFRGPIKLKVVLAAKGNFMIFFIPSFAINAVLNIYNRFNAKGREFGRTHIRPRKQKIKEIEQSREMSLGGLKIALARAEDTLSADHAKLKTLRFQANLFVRNFQSEIEKNQDRKISGYDTLNRLKAELSDAYEDLNSAKVDLDAWYRKSKGNFIGNGRRKLPKHAFFGQSTSARDSLKHKKDSIYKNIQDLKSDKTRVYNNEIKPAKENIGKIKEDQKRWRGLSTKGQTKTCLANKVKSQIARIGASEDRVSQAQEQVERQDQAIDNQIQLIKREIRDLKAEYKEKNK